MEKFDRKKPKLDKSWYNHNNPIMILHFTATKIYGEIYWIDAQSIFRKEKLWFDVFRLCAGAGEGLMINKLLTRKGATHELQQNNVSKEILSWIENSSSECFFVMLVYLKNCNFVCWRKISNYKKTLTGTVHNNLWKKFFRGSVLL